MATWKRIDLPWGYCVEAVAWNDHRGRQSWRAVVTGDGGCVKETGGGGPMPDDEGLKRLALSAERLLAVRCGATDGGAEYAARMERACALREAAEREARNAAAILARGAVGRASGGAP